MSYNKQTKNIACATCPTISSLNIHITAVHAELITKNQIEKEPSYRQKKVVKP